MANDLGFWVFMIIKDITIVLSILFLSNALSGGLFFKSTYIKLLARADKLVFVRDMKTQYWSVGHRLKPNLLDIKLRGTEKRRIKIIIDDNTPFFRFLGIDCININEKGDIIDYDGGSEFKVSVEEYENMIEEALGRPKKNTLIEIMVLGLLVLILIVVVISLFTSLQTITTLQGITTITGGAL